MQYYNHTMQYYNDTIYCETQHFNDFYVNSK